MFHEDSHHGPFGGFGGAGFDGFNPQSGRRLKFAAFSTAVTLLDGPSTLAQIAQRLSETTGGELTPPEDRVKLAVDLLAGRGLVSVDGDVATLTELGRSLLAWRGVTSETADAFVKRAAQFAGGFKLRREMFEVAGLAKSIHSTGTDEQKAALVAARSKIHAAVTEAKKDLHLALSS